MKFPKAQSTVLALMLTMNCCYFNHPLSRSQGAVMKYILVTGGVISGIGKGIIASSVGTILKSCGLHVTAIKIDPYINIDAGTFSPYEHGKGEEKLVLTLNGRMVISIV